MQIFQSWIQLHADIKFQASSIFIWKKPQIRNKTASESELTTLSGKLCKQSIKQYHVQYKLHLQFIGKISKFSEKPRHIFLFLSIQIYCRMEQNVQTKFIKNGTYKRVKSTSRWIRHVSLHKRLEHELVWV